jgi:hypothetical protein
MFPNANIKWLKKEKNNGTRKESAKKRAKGWVNKNVNEKKNFLTLKLQNQ